MQSAWKKLLIVSLLPLFLVSTLGKAESTESFFKKSLKTLRLHRKKAIFAVAVVVLGGVAYLKRGDIVAYWNSMSEEKNEKKGLNSSENNDPEKKDVNSSVDQLPDVSFSLSDIGCFVRSKFSAWAKKKNQECSIFPSGVINTVSPCGNGDRVTLSDFFSRISRSARDTFSAWVDNVKKNTDELYKEYMKLRYENSSPEVYRLHRKFAGMGFLDPVDEAAEAVLYLEKSASSTKSANYVSQAKEHFKFLHDAMVRMRQLNKANESFLKKKKEQRDRFPINSEDKKED